ncbi:MAG: hypothetical protein J4F39_12570 [Candidatus Latescibacteria bacterium]|nr:hypothetical protein [Candidatus Latescibacterota bacterium]
MLEEILEEAHKLDTPKQERVLAFARSLANDQLTGLPGKHLLRFAGKIDRDDLSEIARAIENGCERVGHSERHMR